MKRSRLFLFLPYGFYGLPFFTSYSLYPLPILASGGAAGLRGTFPGDIHTHPWPGEGSFLEKNPPLRWDSNSLASGPRPRSTFSDSHAATEPPRSRLILLVYITHPLHQ
jgi:hypothetical protein